MKHSTRASTFVALLRGINVSGQKLIRMEALRASLEKLGFTSVASYIQSGNVVFAATGSPQALAAKIQACIQRDFGFEVVTVVRSADELRQAAKRNPFLKEKGIDPARLYVSFLSAAPTKPGLDSLKAVPAAPERFHHAGREIYLHLPNGAGRAVLTHNLLEKKLSVSATTRNWNTVSKLCEMAGE